MKLLGMIFCLMIICSSQNSFAGSEDLRCSENLDDYDDKPKSKKRPFPDSKESNKENSPISKKAKPFIKMGPRTTLKSFEAINVNELVAKKGTTIAFVDLDNTLVRPLHLFHNLNLTVEQSKKLLHNFFKRQMFSGDDKQFPQFVEYVISTSDFCSKEYIRDQALVEESSLAVIKAFKEKGAIVMGLTARSFSIADWTHESLKNLGINFAELSQWGTTSITYNSERVGMKNGIFFTGNQFYKFTKVPYLIAEIETHLKKEGPFTVYHFDDNPNEIEAFHQNDTLYDEALDGKTLSNLCIQPYLYTGHDQWIGQLKANTIYQEIDEEFYHARFLKKQESRQIEETSL
jgi:hypothetical protein